jgi:hypothetical protein
MATEPATTYSVKKKTDGIISPDILSIVNDKKSKTPYSKQIAPQLHILRAFQKGSANSRFPVSLACIMQQRPNQALILGS